MYSKFHVWLIFSLKIIEKVYVILDLPSYISVYTKEGEEMIVFFPIYEQLANEVN